MTRFFVTVAAALLVMGIASTAHADRTGFAAAPKLDDDQQLLSLRLVDDFRTRTTFAARPRVRMPDASVRTDKEAAAPGQELTEYVERVWSQARVYRRPGGAEVILRGQF